MSPLRRMPVSGRYRGRCEGFEVELRVDVDGDRPLKRVSADYYDAGSRQLLGSMRVDRTRIVVSDTAVRVTGTGAFTWPTKARSVSVVIPRVPPGQARAPATLRHATPRGAQGVVYVCDFTSTSFRTAVLEEAIQQEVIRFVSYDTSLLPSGGRRRELSAQAAFEEAGIELVSGGPPTTVEALAAGSDLTWSDAELHAAMEQHFRRLEDRPQWAIWLLHASAHDDLRLSGLMFDRRGLHRQGCAVFYRAIGGTGPTSLRRTLHTCIHELGHGFNLPHSWQESRVTPPVPSRPDAASWMNYPQRFPGGERAFWPQFAFEFDEHELAHLRHGFEDDVIMGGRPFVGGAADVGPEPQSGAGHGGTLRLKLDAPRELDFGVPVTVMLELAATTARSQPVPPILGPRVGNVDIVIRGPDGRESVFEPLLRHCRGPETVALCRRDRPIRDHAFIHYGKDGFAFERPGRYVVRARFVAFDGSCVLSNAVAIRVRAPVTQDDRQIERMIAGDDDVGKLMSLMGSDEPVLRRADHTLQEIIDRYPSHPLADVARVVRATNAAREFKLVAPNGEVDVRRPDFAEAHSLAEPVLNLPKVHRATPAGVATSQETQAVARALTRAGTKPGVSLAVRRFLGSRRLEIATVIPALPAAKDRPPGALTA